MISRTNLARNAVTANLKKRARAGLQSPDSSAPAPTSPQLSEITRTGTANVAHDEHVSSAASGPNSHMSFAHPHQLAESSDLGGRASSFSSSSTGTSFSAAGHRDHSPFIPTHILPRAPSSPPMAQRRAFHATVGQMAKAPSTTFQQRTHIPTSSWARPPQASQDADDNVVPTFYIERKRQRKEEEGGLMAELSAGILSEGVAARTRAREEKIPVEVRAADGTVLHPSGFEPPTPETDFHPAAAKTPTADDPDGLVATVKQHWDEREFPDIAKAAPDAVVQRNTLARVLKKHVAQAKELASENGQYGASDAQIRGASAQESTFEQRSKIPTSAWDEPGRAKSGTRPREDVVPPFYIERKRQRDTIAERKEEEGGLMHELSAGILSDDVGVDIKVREEKIPVEFFAEDGSVVHPSGFAPPTPETDFHPMSAKPAEAPPKTSWTELPLKTQRA